MKHDDFLCPLDAEDAQAGDWLGQAWGALPDAFRVILTRRVNGETLGTIATSFDLSRERIRQLQAKAEALLVDAQTENARDLETRVGVVLADRAAVPEVEIATIFPTRAAVARMALLRQWGISNPRVWRRDCPGYWTRHPASLEMMLKRLVDLAPMSDNEAMVAAGELGIPPQMSIVRLLEDPASKLVHHSVGWIRCARSTRDAAFLWLRSQGEPRTAADIASIVGGTDQAVREAMRRDSDFVLVRPDGTWALADWRLPGIDNRYRNAVDVIVDVLRELGPLEFEELRAESQRRYPVSTWRITQCLSSAVIGIDGYGRYDLAERGATPMEDSEPDQPPSIKVHGTVVGVELRVDSEMLRGSGVAVNRWLTWYLGLRNAPSTRCFQMIDQPGTLTVKRATSSSQLSSLRAVVLGMGLVEGCRLAVLLNTEADAARITHICVPGACAVPDS